MSASFAVYVGSERFREVPGRSTCPDGGEHGHRRAVLLASRRVRHGVLRRGVRRQSPRVQPGARRRERARRGRDGHRGAARHLAAQARRDRGEDRDTRRSVDLSAVLEHRVHRRRGLAGSPDCGISPVNGLRTRARTAPGSTRLTHRVMGASAWLHGFRWARPGQPRTSGTSATTGGAETLSGGRVESDRPRGGASGGQRRRQCAPVDLGPTSN